MIVDLTVTDKELNKQKKERAHQCSNEYLHLGLRFKPQNEKFIEMMSKIQLLMDKREILFYLDSDGRCEEIFLSKYMINRIKCRGWVIPKALISNFEDDFIKHRNLDSWEKYKSYIISFYDWHDSGKWLFTFDTELPFTIDICQDN